MSVEHQLSTLLETPTLRKRILYLSVNTTLLKRLLVVTASLNFLSKSAFIVDQMCVYFTSILKYVFPPPEFSWNCCYFDNFRPRSWIDVGADRNSGSNKKLFCHSSSYLFLELNLQCNLSYDFLMHSLISEKLCCCVSIFACFLFINRWFLFRWL